jgi:hypothetical protein
MPTSLHTSVAEPHHFYAAQGENFDAATAPTLLYSKPKFFKGQKFNISLTVFFLLILCNKICSKYA